MEENPGPKGDDIQKLLSGQEAILKEVREVKAKQANIEAEVKDLGKRMATIASCVNEIEEMKSKVVAYEGQITRLNRAIEVLSSKVDDLENRSRRNNLVLYGVNEIDKETQESLYTMVVEDIF